MLHTSKVIYLVGLFYPMLTIFADTRITSKYTAEGQTTETTTYAKGETLRYQYGKDVTLLRDCGRNRITNLDEKNRTFVSLPDELPAGGIVSNITPTDTGERKQVFNRTARHLHTTAAEDNGARVETDGWYIDAKEMPSCAAGSNQQGANSMGYPVSYTITTYKDKDGAGPSSTVSMEVTELVDAPLDPAMFEVPAGYADAVKQALPVNQKAAGAIRVGAVAMHNKPGHAPVNPAVYEHMMAQLRAAGIEVVPLADVPAETVGARAKEAQCDYLLYTELASVEKPATGKVGGLLRKTPGLGKTVAGDAMEAKVSYRLIAAGSDSPALADTAIGKTGTAFNFNWKTAVTVASTVTPMLMMARMMGGGTALNPNMMNALASGKGYGGSMAGMDPMMNTMSLCLRAANVIRTSQAPANPAATDNAIAAALDQEAKAIVAHLKK